MAQIKKNVLTNIIFPMVDRVDFASIESAITASDFNSAAIKKFFGVTHGNSDAFTSGTISKATTLVHSGIFQQTLKTTETNYDYLVIRFTPPSCADQILIFEPLDYDDSDVMSRLSDIGSDLRSFLAVMSGIQSDAYSMLSDFYSDFQSRVPKAVATNSQLSDLHSDLRSVLIVMSDVLSDFYSDFQSRVPKRVATDSYLSDVHSDLASKIAGITATLSVSDISDIASAVWAAKYTAHSAASSFGSLVSDIFSRVALIQSNVSDVESQVDLLATSNYLSQVHSDLASKIGGITASVSASDISDIASAVWAHTIGARVDSRVLVVLSQVSDIDSMLTVMSDVLSDFYSDFQSRVPKRVATDSYLSDVHSDLASKIAGITATLSVSDISDIASAVWATALAEKLVTLNTSDMSDLRSAIAAGPAATITASDISNIASAVWSEKYNVYSALASAFGSFIVQQTQGASNLLSNISALVSDVDSQLLLNASMISDVHSLVSDFYSDFQSRVPKRVATDSQLSDVHSDLRSQIAGITASVSASDISDIASAVQAILASDISDIKSAAQQGNSRILVVQSMVSDVDSQLLLTASVVSDVYSLLSDLQSDFQSRVPKRVATDSQLSDVHSDLASKIAGITATLSVSDISDIASAVKVILASDISDILSAAVQTNSRVLVVQSLVSDIDSALTSQFVFTSNALSDLQSDLTSQIAGITASVSASDISDIASAVKATLSSDLSDILSAAQQTNSRTLVVQSHASDIYSLLSDVGSDLIVMSGIVSDIYSSLQAGFALDASSMSDIRSAIAAGPAATVTASDISDIASAVWENASRTLTQSAASVSAAVTGANVTVYRGTTWSISLTGLPSLTLYDVVYFSVKEKVGDADTAAWLRIKNGASGLERFMSAAPASAANGTLTTPTSTSITVTINEAETVNALLKNNLLYDIKGIDNDGNVDLVSSGGLFNIGGDLTRAIT